MKYNTFFKLVIVILLLTAAGKSQAQRIYDTTTTNLMAEISDIQGYHYTTPYLSFDATYYMTDVDTVTVRDTIVSKYKINGDSLYILMLNDTIESIQNENYYGTVYHNDSTIVIQKPVSFTRQIFQVDVNDSLFQNMALKGITVTDSSCYRRVTMTFDSNAIYKSMKMAYCKTTNYLLYITYTLKKEPTPNTTKLMNMEIRFSNYQIGQFGSSVFSTDPFFKVNSVSDIQLAPGMSPTYEIVNLLEQ